MKTTLEIPDALFRKVKARAAISGQPMRIFVIEAMEQKIRGDRAGGLRRPKGWRAVFGKASSKATSEIQSLVKAEFDAVNLDEWK